MTATATSPVDTRPALPTPSEESTSDTSHPSTPATTPSQSPNPGLTRIAAAATRHQIPRPTYPNTCHRAISLPRSKTNDWRREISSPQRKITPPKSNVDQSSRGFSSHQFKSTLPKSKAKEANPSLQKPSLPKSKAHRLRREQQQWQHMPSTTVQPWYTTRAHIPPLSLHIPHSSYTPQDRSYQLQQAKTKAPGALCLMSNASPYPHS